MAGAKPKFRHLSRSSAHRQALLRNMLESLIEHEQIQTTYAKAKECQRLADKLITLGKKNTQASRNRAEQIFYRPQLLIPKLFGELRQRYQTREGGYTRVLLTESPKEDQARSAILELVDSPRDMRFNMTARTIAREMREGLPRTDITARNVEKVTRYRPGGMEALTELAQKLVIAADPAKENVEVKVPEKKLIYPKPAQLFGKARNMMGRKPHEQRKLKQGDHVYKETRWG